MSEKSPSDNINSTGMHDIELPPLRKWVSIGPPPPPPMPELLMKMSDEELAQVYNVSDVTLEFDLKQTMAALKELDEGTRDEDAMDTPDGEPRALAIDGEVSTGQVWDRNGDFGYLCVPTRAFLQCGLMGFNPKNGKLEVTLQLILREEEFESDEEEDAG